MGPVLVIDDEIDSRSGMAESLRLHGYEAIEVGDGREALDYLLDSDGDEPGCILLDLAMPVMSGWELIAIVKSYYRLARIPIVVVSGKAKLDDALRHGVIDGFIQKPHEPRALADVIGAAMRASSSMRTA